MDLLRTGIMVAIKWAEGKKENIQMIHKVAWAQCQPLAGY